MRPAPEEELMIIAIEVRPLRDPAEAPAVDLPCEAGVLGVAEEHGDDLLLEGLGLEHPPAATVRHPRDDAAVLTPAQDAVQLQWEVALPA